VPAATVIVVRDSAGGVETLMLRRNPHGAFGGMWVFPGGRVDPEDADPDAPGDALAAARRAAVREAAEEAGIVVDAHTIVPFAHWEPPPVVPKRFATWFFVTRAAEEHDVTIDGHEIHDHAWLSPAEVLRRHGAGDVELAPPTWVTLHWLSLHSDVASMLDEARSNPPEHFVTQHVKTDTVSMFVWHGDVAYGPDGGDPHRPGPRHRLVAQPGMWRYERSA